MSNEERIEELERKVESLIRAVKVFSKLSILEKVKEWSESEVSEL